MNLAPSPYAAPSQQGAAYAATDEDDRAILQEAWQGQLLVEDKTEQSRSADGKFGRGAMMLLGTHTAERVRAYRVRAADGLTWTYTQPYSMARQMPGEHAFILNGSFPSPVEVLPASNQWRRVRFYLVFGMLTFVLLFFFGLGLLLPPLLILLVPPWPKLRSPDAALAKWLGSQPRVKSVLRSTKFGWVGLLGAGGWKLRWVVQLHSLGDGTSRLVVKAPDVGRVSLTRYRVGFLQAAAIARAFAGVLPQVPSPPQAPLQG